MSIVITRVTGINGETNYILFEHGHYARPICVLEDADVEALEANRKLANAAKRKRPVVDPTSLEGPTRSYDGLPQVGRIVIRDDEWEWADGFEMDTPFAKDGEQYELYAKKVE